MTPPALSLLIDDERNLPSHAAATAESAVDLLAANALRYTQQLCQFASVTPDDAGSFAWLWQKLVGLGFCCEEITEHGVRNLLATRRFGDGPTLAFAGHLDVVPANQPQLWRSPPFAAEIVDGEVVARGVADMKGAIACFIAALEQGLTEQTSTFARGSLQLLITCDEEGEAEFGTRLLIDTLRARNALPDYCLIGEPSSKQRIGDAIKIGRRGALSCAVQVSGKAGHVAYPKLADNAAHKVAAMVQALTSLTWDEGSDDFPGSSLQVTYINTGDFTDNIVPARAQLAFNIRHSHRYTQPDLVAIVTPILQAIDPQVQLDWQRPCPPYFTERHAPALDFIAIIEQQIHQQTGGFPLLCTSGGTSDGRFIASPATQVIELGLCYHSIHQRDERVPVAHLHELANLYCAILRQLHQAATPV